MMYRSRAPLRIGLAGGGTDVSPYSDIHGGAILNATISLSAYASIELLKEPEIIIEALDRKEQQRFNWDPTLPINGELDLLKGVYNRVSRDFGFPQTGFRLVNFCRCSCRFWFRYLFHPCCCHTRCICRDAQIAFG
ncbi:MAG: hypothetical protein V9E88_13395 [Ferruginibacter sp.]